MTPLAFTSSISLSPSLSKAPKSRSTTVCRRRWQCSAAVPKQQSPDGADEESPVLKEPPVRTDDENSDVASAYSIGETLKDSPVLNSTLMNAMRDYFGDDGREVQDYMKRPRNSQGEPMFRVVVVGSGEQELKLMQVLYESDVVSGLYYCPDEGAVCDIEMQKYGQSARVSAYKSPEEVVSFAKWIVADAVFVGPERGGLVGKEREVELAEAGITMFGHDVSDAVSSGTIDVRECLMPLAGEEEDSPTEQLVE